MRKKNMEKLSKIATRSLIVLLVTYDVTQAKDTANFSSGKLQIRQF